MSDTISHNKLVTITYAIQNELGKTIEQNNLPVSYVHGAGSELLPVLEKSLEGKQAGDCVEVMVPPADGFGKHDPELVLTDYVNNVPPEYRKVGAQAEFKSEDGEVTMFTVLKVGRKKITMDGNHPLAGKIVKFIVNIQEVRDATEEEIAQRQFESYSQDAVDADPSKAH